MIRIGFIEYLNSYPLSFGFNDAGANIIRANPSEIAHLMSNNQLDCGQMSSYEFLQRQDQFVALNQFCISSREHEVQSVLLISKKEISDLNEEQIALTNHSITSVQLLKIIFKEKFNIEPYFTKESLSTDDLLTNRFKSMLLIGDDALKARKIILQNKTLNWQYYDLASLWSEFTGGMPFVFAVFAIRKDLWERNSEKFNPIIKSISANLRKNLSNLEPLINYSLNEEIKNMNFRELKDYFDCLSYDLDLGRQKSLNEFCRLSGLNTHYTILE